MNYLERIVASLPETKEERLFALKEGSLTNFQKDAISNISKLLLKLGTLSFDYSMEDYEDFIKKEYEALGLEEFTVKKNVKEFNYYKNEASFWMATGSGKTFVIAKLIDNLFYLMEAGLIPKKQIMLLAPSDVILNQIKSTAERICIENFNFVNLKDHREELFGNVYYYNGTNIAHNEQISKKKGGERIDYEDYGNSWYVILDEAHKGSGSEGVRREYYQAFGQNGFIFNFSATLTEKPDINTTIYNYNLSKFIADGFGKQIAVMESVHKDFKNENYLTILKSIILFTAIKRKKPEGQYHNPLCLGLVDTVSATDSNLSLFFKAILDFKSFEQNFEEAKEGLKREIREITYQFTGDKVCDFDLNFDFNDLLKLFYNAEGGAEKVVYVADKKTNEVAMRLDNSSEYFALVKIGNIATFIKILEPYTKENVVMKEFFKNINNENSKVNILLGSRVFVEGWDSNRPNIINLVNIGSAKAKQYVTQMIGRGVRIEPKKGERKRLGNAGGVPALESLFIFATSKEAIETVLGGLNGGGKKQMTVSLEGIFKKNDSIKIDLYLPLFENTTHDSKKIELSNIDVTNVKKNIESYALKHLIANFIKENIVIDNIDIFKNLKNYITAKDIKTNALKPERNLKNLLQFQKREIYEFNDKLVLTSNILHFNQIKMTLIESYVEKQTEIIDFIKTAETAEEFLELQNSLKQKKEKTEFEKLLIEFSFDKYIEYIKEKSSYNDDFYVYRKLENHYYNPFIVKNTKEKVNFTHAIEKNESEEEFMKQLIENHAKLDEKYNWCFTRNDVGDFFIPYEIENEFRKFYPDFIFWLESKNNSNEKIILFIDPKGLKQGQDETIAKIKGFEFFLSKRVVDKKNIFTFKLGIYNENSSSQDLIEKYRFFNFIDFFNSTQQNKD